MLSPSGCPAPETGALLAEFDLEPEVDRGARDVGNGAPESAAEMDAAGGRMLSFFVALDFGFLGAGLCANKVRRLLGSGELQAYLSVRRATCPLET